MIVLAVALVTAAPGAGEPPAIKAKQEQAQRVLAQVNALDVQLGRVGEQLDGARYELAQTEKRERKTEASLAIARRQYEIAEQRVVSRLVTLYDSDPPPSTVDAVLGASSLSSILDRVQFVNSVNQLDRHLAQTAKAKRAELKVREQALQTERDNRAAAVAAIAAHQGTINAELGQRRTLLSSIQGEVRKLQAVEAARQARLAAAARARLEAQQKLAAAQAAAAKAAAAKAAAERAAAARAAAAKAATTTTSTTTTSATTTSPATTDPTTTDPGTSTDATTTTAAPPAPPAPTAPAHPEAATLALQYLGIKYVFGGGSPATGFDCSGLVMYVYAQLGIQLPHYAAAQYGYGVPVPRADLEPGDLVFFDGLSHVGIWLGGNELIDAPHTGDVVKIETLSGWYASNYVGARRL